MLASSSGAKHLLCVGDSDPQQSADSLACPGICNQGQSGADEIISPQETEAGGLL